MRSSLARAAAALPLALVVASCLSVAPECTPAPAPALNVTVVDAATGAYRAAGATVTVTEGDYAADLEPGDFAPSGERATRHGPFGRAGVYAVTVRHPGYETWQREGVRVETDRCGVVTVPLRAELRPVA